MKTNLKPLLVIGLFLAFPATSMAATLTDNYNKDVAASCPNNISAEDCTPDYITAAAPNPRLCATKASMDSRFDNCTNVARDPSSLLTNPRLQCSAQCIWTSRTTVCDPLNRNTTNHTKSPTGNTYANYIFASNKDACGGCKAGFADYGTGTCTPALFDMLTDGTNTDTVYYQDGTLKTYLLDIDTLWDSVGADIYYNDGKVGIGSASYTKALNVKGDITNTGLSIQIPEVPTNDPGRWVTAGAELTSIEFGYNSESYSPVAKIAVKNYNTTGTGWYSSYASRRDAGLTFSVINNNVPAEALTINNLGNVGIGTTTPSYPLHIKGPSVYPTIETTDNFAGLTLKKSGSGDIYVERSADSFQLVNMANGPINFFTNAAQRMTINSVGNVGIGTTTPAYKLHVSDRMKLDGGSAGMWIEAGTSDWFTGRTGADYRIYNQDYSDVFTLQQDGDIYLDSRDGRGAILYRTGGMALTWDADDFGGTNSDQNHGIYSVDGWGNWSDDITMNSYGNIRLNIDSNNNGTNIFSIGTATTDTNVNTLLILDENGYLLTRGLGSLGNVEAWGNAAISGNVFAGGNITGNNVGKFYTLSPTSSVNTLTRTNNSSITTSASDGLATPAGIFGHSCQSGWQPYWAITLYCRAGDIAISLGTQEWTANDRENNFYPPYKGSIDSYTVINYPYNWGGYSSCTRPSGFTNYRPVLTCFSPNG